MKSLERSCVALHITDPRYFWPQTASIHVWQTATCHLTVSGLMVWLLHSLLCCEVGFPSAQLPSSCWVIKQKYEMFWVKLHQCKIIFLEWENYYFCLLFDLDSSLIKHVYSKHSADNINNNFTLFIICSSTQSRDTELHLCLSNT